MPGEPETVLALDVYLPIPSWKHYSYSVSRSEVPSCPRGCRVVVPLRKTWTVGLCDGVRPADTSEELLAAREFLDRTPCIPDDLWALGMWLSHYYFCPPGLALSSMLPSPFRPHLWAVLEPRELPGDLDQATIPENVRPILTLLTSGPVRRRTVEKLLGSPQEAARGVLWLVERGWAAWSADVRPEPAARTVAVARLVTEGTSDVAVSPAGARLLEALRVAGGELPVRELLAQSGSSRSALVTLEKRGCVTVCHSPLEPPSLRHMPAPPLSLTPDQLRAVHTVTRAVETGGFQAFLLHGVTGSGKTEVYLAAASAALEAGLGVVCLVPEIALTAQMVARFRGRFGARVLLLHSGLSPGERSQAWNSATTHPAPLVIGPRSAVFAPVRNLGLIIVDEEHDSSYKQERDPRYNGRDVAIMRAHQVSCPVLLGSATPSLESYHHAQAGKYTLLDLPRRVDDWPMPAVSIVDMKAEARSGPSVFSSILKRGIEETVTRGAQVLLLLNRRGYARSLQCADCGIIPKCPDCDISLTFHRHNRRLICHYCDYAEPAPEVCPSCHGHRLGFGSIGTERLQAEVQALLPGVRVLRMDRDTTRSRGAHVRIIDAMEHGDAQVLVGTQMVAKGLDLPNVMLVGVVNADTPVQFPDFRAGERAFQLLTQVAGRAGRSMAGGEVVLQSYLVDYPSLLCAARHDYHGFAREEMATRSEAGYPPYTHLIRLEVRGRVVTAVDEFASVLGTALKAARRGHGARVLGPAPPLLPRLRGWHRRHLLVFHRSRPGLHGWVREALVNAGDPREGVRLVIDVDPLETV